MDQRGKQNQNEHYARERYNSKSLMEAYRQLTEPNDVELGDELTERDENPNLGALMHTYAQVMDSYREGTIQQKRRGERSKQNRR